MAYPVKQVIIVNTDVPMSKGQLSAQVAHAAVQYMFDNGKWKDDKFIWDHLSSDELYWGKECYCKAVLKVNSKEKLIDLQQQIESYGLKTALVVDYGYNTALAVEPVNPERIDPITGRLPLF